MNKQQYCFGPRLCLGSQFEADGRGGDVLGSCTWPFGGVGWGGGRGGIAGPRGHSRECTHRSFAVFLCSQLSCCQSICGMYPK